MKRKTEKLLNKWRRFLHREIGAPHESPEDIMRVIRYGSQAQIAQVMEKYPQLAVLRWDAKRSAYYGDHDAMLTVPDEQLAEVMGLTSACYGVMTNVEHHVVVMRKLLELLQSPANVLDVGCGICPYTIFLAQQGLLAGRVVGLDASSIALERAREIAQSAAVPHELIAGLASDLPFANSSFELVFSNDCLHFVIKWRRAVREIARVLAPGARLLMVFSSMNIRERSMRWGDVVQILEEGGAEVRVDLHDPDDGYPPHCLLTGQKLA